MLPEVLGVRFTLDGPNARIGVVQIILISSYICNHNNMM